MKIFSRTEAAAVLAARLRPHVSGDVLVLASSRNSVPLALSLATQLGCDLDIVLTRELNFPGEPAQRVASVAESGEILWMPQSRDGAFTEEELAFRIVRALEDLLERRGKYSHARAPADPAGRTAIVVAEGLAGAQAFLDALRAVRARRPARLIAAVAAATPAALWRMRAEADDVVCLEAAESYAGVARTLGGAEPVTEERATELLREGVEMMA